ncbi:MAG: aminotransferase class V-fold PLP-dependent enzyme [Ignavibacteriae bacterium]|nr:aminotransferase class V-fold PLP-dependent enzyme [Ignavibacteriota bacterium]
MTTIEEARNYFPYIKTGLVYFNHAAVGPISTLVKSKLDEYLLQRSETVVENYFETIPQVKSAKEKIARLVNSDVNSIGWTDNVSNAMNIIAQGLDWKYGDQIILNDIEFPANVYPFLNLKNIGVEILFAKSENWKVDLPEIEKLVTSKTRLISISMVQFLSGYRADIKAIGDYCKSKNIIFCVDGIQAAGNVNINLRNYSVDFFAGGTQKWLMGLQGLSYFYISKNLFDKIIPKNIGWTSVKNAWHFLDYKLDLLDNADRFQNGTNSRIAMIAIDESLNLFEKIGYAQIENKILENSTYFIQKLTDNGLNPILKNIEMKNIAGIVSLKINNTENIMRNLKERKIACSLREGLIRFSPHFYNTKDEINYVVDELTKQISV